jgi:hypothetical protein
MLTVQGLDFGRSKELGEGIKALQQIALVVWLAGSRSCIR